MSDIWTGDTPPQLGSQAGHIFEALQKYAPGAIDAISKSLSSTTGGQLSAQQAVAPGYEKLFNENQLASAQTEADVAKGPGASLVSSADQYQKQLDPEFYAQRGNVSAALDKYLGSYDPSKLTPTEEAQISRGIGATGGNLQPSTMNTVKNAQTFGDAGTNRWKNFGDAITKAAGVLPTLKSGMSGFGVATTRGNDTGAFNATNNATNANFGFSSSALNNITGANNNMIAKTPYKDAYDKALAMSQSFSNIAGGSSKLGAGA